MMLAKCAVSSRPVRFSFDSSLLLPLIVTRDKGYCLHGDKCWYKHAADVSAKGSNVAPTIEESPEASANADAPTSEAGSHPCAICFEDNPVQYGLLSAFLVPFGSIIC
jgi:hypothetical protein